MSEEVIKTTVTDTPHTTLTAPPAPDPYAALPRCKRELLMKLDSIDFWRVGKERGGVVLWNGVNVRVFDMTQIQSYNTR